MAVHLDPLFPDLKPSVEMWPRQSEPVEEREEELLEFAPREASGSTQALEAEAQVRVAAMARVAREQGR